MQDVLPLILTSVDIVYKYLQGEDAVHDAIRQQQLAVGATGRILAALTEWSAENEEVLWAVLFSLAVLVRDGANPFQPAIRAVAAAGIPPLLSSALHTYKVWLRKNLACEIQPETLQNKYVCQYEMAFCILFLKFCKVCACSLL